MKYTKIPENTFKNLQLNAGIVVRNFNPETGVASGQIGATTGGVSFTATPEYSDFGEDIDNCPKNMKELKHLDSWGVTMSGTLLTVDAATTKLLIAAGDVSGNKITPRKDLLTTDFEDLWFVGDYSDVNTGNDAGFIAIKVINALNTGGFSLQSSDNGKANFAFSFEGHVSMNAQDVVPFEVYVKGGGSSAGSILFNTHTVELEEDDTFTLGVSVSPSDADITWTSGDTSVATVSSGVITATGAGNTIITGSITVDGVTYDDTCTVVVTEG